VDSGTIFLSTFLLVFIGELGDKTQIAAGTGTLANTKRVNTIFFSSALALTCVAGITAFAAGLIPTSAVPTIKQVGGVLLVLYGIYLFRKAGQPDNEEHEEETGTGFKLFLSHFSVVFIAELGDKTQITTLAVAVENQNNLYTVFLASASALVTVTLITVWGVTKIPQTWVPIVQRIGAALMVAYGGYMLF
jgi:Ca2+/H+ antiporter, TMEM165/GDT1 family